MQLTRQEILNILKMKGRASVDELGKQLGLTSMCIRQHLAILERDQLISSHEQRQKLGRPRLIYSLTEQAEDLFPKSYGQLLDWILEDIKTLDGKDKVDAVFDRLAERMARQFQETVGDKPFREKVIALCEQMNSSGSLAEWEEKEGEYILREHNCRYHSVALKHPDICRIEHGFLGKVFDADIRMVECLLNDGPRCTYIIRPGLES
ncbi:MAG: ArsR family transcriptional regulator [Chloroflexi bacterium]|nr:ArsR family transcriptional regulator [Chloroflexota bacterium]